MSDIGGNSWGDLWDDPCGVSDCFSGVGTSGPVVSVVTDVLVSPSSVVTQVSDGFFMRLWCGISGTVVLVFLQKASSLLDSYAGSDEA